jgi:hypothetical protein
MAASQQEFFFLLLEFEECKQDREETTTPYEVRIKYWSAPHQSINHTKPSEKDRLLFETTVLQKLNFSGSVRQYQ